MQIFHPAPVDAAVLQSALDTGFRDYEDAVLHEAARRVGANGIVTRNIKDFTRATLPVYAPAELLALIET